MQYGMKSGATLPGPIHGKLPVLSLISPTLPPAIKALGNGGATKEGTRGPVMSLAGNLPRRSFRAETQSELLHD